MINHLFHYKAFVSEVYDGDTITAKFDLGFKVSFEEKVRLYGINTPELRGDERPDGLTARDVLRDWILEKQVVIETIKDRKGKYGRYLGVIFMFEDGKWVNVNERLVAEGFAVEADY